VRRQCVRHCAAGFLAPAITIRISSWKTCRCRREELHPSATVWIVRPD
jgi:hypothetical protein